MTQDGLWAVIIAVLGVVVSIGGSYLSFRQQARSLRSTVKGQQSALRISWTSNVVEWGQCCIRTLSEGDHLVYKCSTTNISDIERERIRILHLLSALIDEGRLFFVNIPHGNYGIEKPRAYRGLSPHLIDCLRIAYQIIDGGDFSSQPNESNQRLIDCRRSFVSELQREIDPEWVRKAVEYDEAAVA
jgi:hypothetical protein